MAYSKSQVDRAGRILAQQARDAQRDTLSFAWPDLVDAIEVIEWWRSEHARPLSRVAANLRYYVSEHGGPVVAQRLKRAPTITDKLQREPSMKLSRMADIGGVRAILPDQRAAYRVAARLRRNWTITRFRDYVANPKPDGYRALHLINRNRGRTIEVQLRTPEQDRWANAIEVLSRTIAPHLKFGNGPRELREYLALAAEILALGDTVTVDPEMANRVRSLQAEADTFVRRAIRESR